MAPRVSVRFQWSCQNSCTPQHYSSSILRAFSTTPRPQALGPESPHYVNVPKPVQPTWDRKPDVKGVLPVPRNVFKSRSPHEKTSDEFLDASTPEPKNPHEPHTHAKNADYILYKRRLAESRRQALRAGVKQLHERHETEQKILSKASLAKQRRNTELAMAPPRETDVLTSESVSQSIEKYLKGELPRTGRENIAARRAAYIRRQTTQVTKRQSRLHDLYTHAKEFIVDEKQLDDAIDKAFGTDERPVGWHAHGEMDYGFDLQKNVWAGGIPPGTDELLKQKQTGGSEVAKERMRRVAEELTGGKM